MHAGPSECLREKLRDLSVCFCADLCVWAHSDMSQATSRPHKSMSLGGGILMWKWEQWFLLLNVDKKQSPLNIRPKMMDQLLMHLPSHCERVSVCVRLHASRYMYVSTSLCAVMCPLWVYVYLLIHPFVSTQLGISEVHAACQRWPAEAVFSSSVS